MLVCTVGWRTLIPVRAIPYLTGGTFDARDLAALFYDPDSFAGEGFASAVHPFRVGADGVTIPVRSGEWGQAYYHFGDKPKRRSLDLKHLRRLPAGVFVRRRPFKVLYDFLAKAASENEARGLGYHPAGEFAWMEDRRLTPEQHDVVWQGCGGVPHASAIPRDRGETPARATAVLPAATSKPRRRERLNYDPELQRIAEAIVKELELQRQRIPSLLRLAAKIKEHPDFNPQLAGVSLATLARRIRATWKKCGT